MNGHDGLGAWIPRDSKTDIPVDPYPHIQFWGGIGRASLLDSGSSPPVDGSKPEDSAVIRALEGYLEALRSGHPCSRAELLTRHPEIADALLECLSGLEFIQAAANQLGEAGTAQAGRQSDPVPPSAQLGDYRILREVGRGGMGVVYEAEQVSLGRRVALKVLPFAAAIDPKQRQRFQIEAQAAAQLHHPHIVPIFAVGCDQGIHYYAMQFVEGRSMAAIVRELRCGDPVLAKSVARCSRPSSIDTEEATPSPNGVGPVLVHGASVADKSIPAETGRLTNGFSVPAPATASDRADESPVPTAVATLHQDRAFCRCVARLGADAADALDHAHGLGIIHRDIKPANLLIDQDGAVWITDFGLARFHADLSLTGTGDVVGTLRYMSPEQAQARRGVVDQRTDVYALGVTLYELLTLRPAFDGRDHQELLRQIADDEPIPPRRLNPAIPRDLETIILKAMAKDVSGRYATAQEMAGDLRRFLDDQPIVARRPGPIERGWRWARRHSKQLTSAAAIVVVSLIITTAVSWRFYVGRREALNQYLHYHIKNFPHLERSGVGLVEKATELLFKNGDDPSSREQASQMFDDVITLFKEASELPPTDRESRVVIARAIYRVAYTRFCMSWFKGNQGHPNPTLLAEAQSDYRRSIDLLERIRDESGDDRTTERYLADASGFGGMGCCFRASNKPREAEHYYNRAVELRRDLIRRQDACHDARSRPRLLATDEQDDPINLMSSVHALVWVMLEEGRRADVDRLQGQLEDDFAALAEKFPMTEYQGLRKRWAESLSKMAGENDEPIQSRFMDLDCRLALILDPECSGAHNNLAWIRVRFPDSTSYSPKQALISARKAVELNSGNWMCWNTLGVAAFRLGDWKTAEDALQKSISFNGGTGYDLFFLAMTRWHQGKCKEAREWFDRAVDWIAKNRSHEGQPKHELERFHAEAAGLLGLPGPERTGPGAEPTPGTQEVRQPDATPAKPCAAT
jgi:serine/threonine protein kinase